MNFLSSDEFLIDLVLFSLFASLWWILQRVLRRWMLRLPVGRHALAGFFAMLIWGRMFLFYYTHFVHIVEIRDGSLEYMADLIRPAVVSIRILDAQGKPVSQGSGFFINLRGDVLTNHHVVCCGHRAEVETYDGAVREVVEVLRANREADLALVTTKGTELFPNQPGYRDFIETLEDDLPPQVGSAVYVVGNPLGLKHTVSQGIVAASRRQQGHLRQIQITAPISPGSSGGPVFDYRGRVVGVITSSASDGQNLNFAVTAYGELNTPQDPNWITPYSEWAQREVDEGYGGAFETAAEQRTVWTLVEFYREALKRRPNWEMGMVNLARCDLRLHRFKRAEEQLNTVLKLNPQNAEALYLLGVIFRKERKYREAIDSLTKTLHLDSSYQHAYGLIGEIHLEEENYEAADIACRKAPKDDSTALGCLMLSLGKQKRIDEALEVYWRLELISYDKAQAVLEEILPRQDDPSAFKVASNP